jgi:hypothetical protein
MKEAVLIIITTWSPMTPAEAARVLATSPSAQNRTHVYIPHEDEGPRFVVVPRPAALPITMPDPRAQYVHGITFALPYRHYARSRRR